MENLRYHGSVGTSQSPTAIHPRLTSARRIVIIAIICIHSFQWSTIWAQKFSTGISLTMITSFAALTILQGAFYAVSFAKTDETKTPFNDPFVPLELHDYVVGARIIAQALCTSIM
jgi:hypothetical protein